MVEVNPEIMFNVTYKSDNPMIPPSLFGFALRSYGAFDVPGNLVPGEENVYATTFCWDTLNPNFANVQSLLEHMSDLDPVLKVNIIEEPKLV